MDLSLFSFKEKCCTAVNSLDISGIACKFVPYLVASVKTDYTRISYLLCNKRTHIIYVKLKSRCIDYCNLGYILPIPGKLRILSVPHPVEFHQNSFRLMFLFKRCNILLVEILFALNIFNLSTILLQNITVIFSIAFFTGQDQSFPLYLEIILC